MTLDELTKLGDAAWNDAFDPLACHLNEETEKADRARTKAIVKALRDELQFHSGMAWEKLNDILASNGVEAAGGSTREDEKAVEAAGDKGPVSVNSPAAAPDVCVWAKESNLWTIGCDPLRFPSFVPSKKICKHCNRPISFKEAAR